MGYLLYDHGDSDLFTYLKVLEVAWIVSGTQLSLNELRPGYGLAYSKFTAESRREIKQVPSRVGMLIIYTPSAIVAFWFFVDNLLHSSGWRENATSSRIGILKALIVSAALSVHFLKRDLETLLLHRFSGKTGLTTSIFVSAGYYLMAALTNVAQQKSEQLIPPALDLTWVGVVVFLTGVLGNLYHHVLLRGLRKGGDKKYVIPEGGLFGVFVAPHYVFEILTFVGVFLISQTYYSAAALTFVILYLGSRSYSTKKWYLKKVDRFPRNRWALIPYVF